MLPTAVLILSVLLANAAPAWAETYGLPFRFELNQGQANPGVKYIAHAAGFTANLDETTVTLNLRCPVQMRFVGGNENVKIAAEDKMPLQSHYYRGESSAWRTGLTNYERLVYQDVY